LLCIDAAAVALNVAVVDPDATVTEAGTVSNVLLLDSANVDPPLGAALLIFTVHVDDVAALRLFGLQVTEETEGTVTEAPVADNEPIPVPGPLTPSDLVSPIDVVVADCVSVTWISATTPEPIVVVFRPVTRQVSEPVAGAHRIVFPAAFAAVPTAAPIADTWLAE